MKILYTATVLSHICQFHQPHMKMLQERGWEVHVAARNNLAVKNGLQLKYCDKFIEIPFERSPTNPNNLKAYSALRKLLAQEHYDVILCNTPVAGVLTRMAAKNARKRGTKVIYMAHGFHFFQGSSRVSWMTYYPIERHMARYCDLLITISNEDYALAQEVFQKFTHVEHIHGIGVDEQRYHPATSAEQKAMRKAEGLDADDFAVLCVGELNENKNQKTLVAAAAQLKAEIPHLKILLAGNGPAEPELRHQVETLGLQDTVLFLGYRIDLERVTPMVDLVASCSRREGMPLNIIEAMLCKKPVVASHNRGHDELVTEETGVLLSPDDVEGFAEAIRRFSNSPEERERAGECAFEKAERYTVREVKQELGGIMTEFIKS